MRVRGGSERVRVRGGSERVRESVRVRRTDRHAPASRCP